MEQILKKIKRVFEEGPFPCSCLFQARMPCLDSGAQGCPALLCPGPWVSVLVQSAEKLCPSPKVPENPSGCGGGLEEASHGVWWHSMFESLPCQP